MTYAAAAFVTLQAARLIFPATTLKGLYDKLVVLAFVGFPIALVIAWAFELTPEGVRRTREVERRTPGAEEPGDGTPVAEGEPPAERRPRSRVAMQALVVLGLLGAAVAGGWYLVGGGGEAPEVSERTVAVLPFRVSGSGAEAWRDGMVTMLSTGLDGAGGLRAIADQTVFAAWEDTGRTRDREGASRSLAAARRVGAQYAVVGQAVKLGGELRLAADIHDTRTGDRIDQVEVAGASDRITALADTLTRAVLGVLLEARGEDLPSVDLGSLTSRSLPALKSYLAGERHFRAGDYRSAIQDYEAALEADSAFALAHARLSLCHGWLGRFDTARQQMGRAYELSDRLPARERAVVRAWELRYRERPRAASDTLRRTTRRYPDDPVQWYTLGEVLVHGRVPPGWPEAERAFARAVELDPGVAAYHHHLVDLALGLRRDSALVARRLATHPDGPRKRTLQLGRDLVFGSPEAREKAWARLDTISLSRAESLARWAFLHPSDAPLANRVLHRVRQRSDVRDDFLVWLSIFNEQRQGHLEDATRRLLASSLGDPYRTCNLAQWSSLGMPVADSALGDRPELPSGEADALAGPEFVRLFCWTLHLLERGRTAEADTIMDYLESAGPGGEDTEVAMAELAAYRAWKTGDPGRAHDLWPSRTPGVNTLTRGVTRALWRGDLARDVGDLREAEGWYLAAWQHPVAHERLGQLYRQMDRPEKAAAAYERFVRAWRDADEPLQTRVEEARRHLRALSGPGADSEDR